MNRAYQSKVKLARKGSVSLVATIPKEIATSLGAKPGDLLDWKKLSTNYIVKLVKDQDVVRP